MDDELKELVKSLEAKVDTLHEKIDDLHIDVVEKYVKKEDNDKAHSMLITFLVGIFTTIIVSVGSMYAYVSSNFSTIWQRLIK